MKDVRLKGPFAVTTFHSRPLKRSLEYGKGKGYGPDALLDDRYKFNPKAQAAICGVIPPYKWFIGGIRTPFIRPLEGQ